MINPNESDLQLLEFIKYLLKKYNDFVNLSYEEKTFGRYCEAISLLNALAYNFKCLSDSAKEEAAQLFDFKKIRKISKDLAKEKERRFGI